jgi:hypothetical protein
MGMGLMSIPGTPVIVHAIKQERKRLSSSFLKGSTSLRGEGGRKTVEVARKEELKSMLELLRPNRMLHIVMVDQRVKFVKVHNSYRE